MAYKIGHDKKKHFLVGMPLGALLQLSAYYFFPGQTIWAITTSVVALTIICYGFELFSLVTRKGHADNIDAIAGILGGIIGIVLFWAIFRLI